MIAAPLWLEITGYLGAAVMGALLALLAILLASLRRAKQIRAAGPATRIEVIRKARDPGDRRKADERARRVVEMWAEAASRLDGIDSRIVDYNRRMVEEVAAAYGRELTDFRLSRAAKRVALLLSDDLTRPLAVFDRFLTVSNMMRAHRYYQQYRQIADKHAYIEPSLRAANSVRRWAVRAYRVLNLAIPQLLFYEAATSAAVHFGKRYVQEEMRELTLKVGAAAIEIYGEALVGRGERELIEASLLFDLLVRMARVGGLTPEKDLLLKRFLKRTAGDLERVEDLYARFREELGRSDVEAVASLLELAPEREKAFFQALEELATANQAGTSDRARADELLREIRARFEQNRREREEASAVQATLPPPPAEPASFETILLELIAEEAGGEEIAAWAERIAASHEEPTPELVAYFENEAHFFRALDVERFRVSPAEAQYLLPRLARIVAAVRLYSPARRAHRDSVEKALRLALGADADADPAELYEEMRRAVEEPEKRSLWSRLARFVSGDPRVDLLPATRILKAARRLSG